MLFKILHGDDSNISVDITPFHEGYCYVTHGGYMYIDMNIGTKETPNNQRIKLNAENAETLCGLSLDELKAHIANQDTVVLAESQTYTDQAIEAAKADATTQDAVILHEAQAYTDAKTLAIVEQMQTKADAEHTHTTLNLENLSIGGVNITQFIESIVQQMMDAGRIIETNGGDTND